MEDKKGYPLVSEDILNGIIEKSKGFAYNPEKDPLYGEYKRLYASEGKKAAEHIYGLSAGRTGGYGNSYGVTAASGVMADFMDKFSKKALELKGQAEKKHRDSVSELYRLYSVASANEDKAYRKNLEKEKSRLEAEREERESQERLEKQKLEKARFLASFGDYSALKDMGVDLTALNDEKLMKVAEIYAKYGDYTLLRKMGVDIREINRDDLMKDAEILAKYGDYSLLRKLGVDTSSKEHEAYYKKLMDERRYKKSFE